MEVWIITGGYQSSDQYGPLIFSKKPSEDLLERIAFCWDGDEEERDGPGDFGSYVYLNVYKITVDDFIE